MSLIDEVYSNIKERKHNVEIGKINGIPFPIKSMRKYIPSVEKSSYFLVTGMSKTGKSQMSNFIFLYNSILYAYKNPDKLSVHIILFPLEEGSEMTLCRFMSFVLYTKYNIRISPSDLMSSNPEKPVSDEIVSILESDEFMNIINYFNSCVQFEEANTSVGIDIVVRNYAKNNGTIIYGDETFVDEDGKERHKISGYKPNNPKEFTFVYIDHANLLSPTKDEKTILNAITELSKNLVKYYRTYKYINVLVQQQNDQETGSLEAVKMDNILPTKAGLKDCKATAQDCTCMLGICNPGYFQNLTTKFGYDLIRLKRKYLRICNIIFQRFGEAEIIAPLYFDGAVNFYKEMPKPDDTEGMNNVYQSIDKIEKGDTKRFVFSMLFKNIFKKNRK